MLLWGAGIILENFSWRELVQVNIAPLSMVIFYFGIFLFLFGHCLSWLTTKKKLPFCLNFMIKLLIVLGTLALPIYIFHGAVIPLKNILLFLGISGKISLGVPLGIFFVIFGWAGFKLYKLYFFNSEIIKSSEI